MTSNIILHKYRAGATNKFIASYPALYQPRVEEDIRIFSQNVFFAPKPETGTENINILIYPLKGNPYFTRTDCTHLRKYKHLFSFHRTEASLLKARFRKRHETYLHSVTKFINAFHIICLSKIDCITYYFFYIVIIFITQVLYI